MEKQIENLKNMIESGYVYGGSDPNSYNYKTYIEKYKDILGELLFEKIYIEHLEYLKNNFTINIGVYTDSEGLSYNSLTKI